MRVEIPERIVRIGVDEAGRGPLLGRVYAGAVILDTNLDVDSEWIRDSKTFHTAEALEQAATHIRSICVASATAFSSAQEIDKINIRKATHRAMHRAIDKVVAQCELDVSGVLLLIDGNDFTPYTKFAGDQISAFNHQCIIKGDAQEPAIAAASILAKVDHDAYIRELCSEDSTLDDKYGLLRNKGYGTAAHIAGIREHGISSHHRRSFGICKNYHIDLVSGAANS